MHWLYDIGFALYALASLPILLFRGKWHSGFRERFGWFSPETAAALAAGPNIWIHAVSVGEVAAVEEIIAGLKRRYPGRQIILTVATVTGHSFAVRKYRGVATVIWAPIDLSPTVDSFVRTVRPELYIAAETELWPNLFRRLDEEGVPILVLNGRISARSFPRYRAAKPLLAPTLRRVRLFAMQSQLDADRMIAMGAPRDRVRVAGNVKFDAVADALQVRPEHFGLTPEDRLLVAGSTHPGEDEILIDIYTALRSRFPDLRLALAPRHPERAPAIASLVARAGLRAAFYSSHQGPIDGDTVLVMDTIGHLLPLYAAAWVVFVGKSLTVGGGHNIIEPAMFGKPVLTGPLLDNFRDIAQAFRQQNALIEVPDAIGLKAALGQLLASPEEARVLGERARNVVLANRGAGARMLDMLASELASPVRLKTEDRRRVNLV